MEFRQLKYFVTVAETLNFSAASKALFITQSTLSQQIRQLEQELGTQLLHRNSHSVELTETGQALLPQAIQTLQDAESCFDRIQDLQELLGGTLNIGVTYTFSPILTESLLTFMKQYPKVKLNIHYKPMDELMEMLQCRKVDFVLAFKPSKRYKGIESHVIFDNYLAVVVHEYHSLAKKEKVSLEELQKYDLALPSNGMQARNAFNKLQSRHFCKFNIRIELNSINILLQLIRQSEHVTILSEASIHNASGIKAIPIDVAENEMEGCVHTLKDCYRKHSAQEFIQILSESNAVRERLREWI